MISFSTRSKCGSYGRSSSLGRGHKSSPRPSLIETGSHGARAILGARCAPFPPREGSMVFTFAS